MTVVILQIVAGLIGIITLLMRKEDGHYKKEQKNREALAKGDVDSVQRRLNDILSD